MAKVSVCNTQFQEEWTPTSQDSLPELTRKSLDSNISERPVAFLTPCLKLCLSMCNDKSSELTREEQNANHIKLHIQLRQSASMPRIGSCLNQDC